MIELYIGDGTTTIYLGHGSANCTLTDYVMRAPEVEVQEAGKVWEDGGEITGARYRNVTETIEVVWATLAKAEEEIEEIGALLHQARVRQVRGRGKRVYLHFLRDTGGEVFRSEILTGTVQPDENAIGTGWASGAIQAQIHITRRWFWEGPESSYLSLTNINGTSSAGLEIDNMKDGTHQHYVTIAAASVEGELPTPALIEIENTSATVDALHFYVGHQVNGLQTADFIFNHEGELLTAGSLASVTNTSDLTCSNERYGRIATASYNIEIQAGYWLLSSANLLAYGGLPYWAFLRVRSAPTADTWVRLELAWSTVSAPIWQGQRVKLSTTEELQPICLIPLPPFEIPVGLNPTPLHLRLIVELPTSAVLDVDYLLMMPTDGWRQFDLGTYTLDQSAKLVDDGINGNTYIVATDGTAFPYPDPKGDPILLYPGKDQRIAFISTDSDLGSTPLRTSKIRIKYRPRRLTFGWQP